MARGGDAQRMPTVVHTEVDLLRYTLSAPAGGSGVRSIDVLGLWVTSAEGERGFGFSYVIGGLDDLPLQALRLMLERFVTNVAFDHPAAVWERIAASFHRTGGGPYRTALAAVDVALWDLVAKRAGVPLGIALGGTARSVDAYGSGGFRADQSPSEAAEVACMHAARGFRAVKVRAAATAADRALFEAVVASGVALMVDANERASPFAAIRLLDDAAAAGAIFVEEPVPAGDVAAYRLLAARSPVPLACGEHLRTIAAADAFVQEGLVQLVQPDLAALGGLTPALALSRFAAYHGIAVAPHFLPGLFIHLAAAATNVVWLEEFPLLEPLLCGLPQARADGTYVLPLTPGHGIDLDAGARRELTLAKSP